MTGQFKQSIIQLSNILNGCPVINQPTTTTELVQIFKVLSDATRFGLLSLLLTHDLCVGALARRLGISEAAVSQHLKQLREVGLVKGEKRGYWTHYAVERNRLNKVAEALTGLTGLARCPDGACTNHPNKKTDCRKDGAKMCECTYRYPQRLKGNPEENAKE